MTTNAPADYATRRWNPTTGCSPVSEGCANCWASRFAKRHRGRFGYSSVAPFMPTTHPYRLDEPLRWSKPQVVAVSFMGDLFHQDIPTEYLWRVLIYIQTCPHHTFLLLTKRIRGACALLTMQESQFHRSGLGPLWPLPNVWLGVSVEDQRTADERIPILLDTPAAHRWVSLEPQIGPVDLGRYVARRSDSEDPTGCDCDGCDPQCQKRHPSPRIDWVVQGCESGPRRRPFDIAWARSVRDQCASAGVPYYYKQGPGEPCTKRDEDCPLGPCDETCDERVPPIVKHPTLDCRQNLDLPFVVAQQEVNRG